MPARARRSAASPRSCPPTTRWASCTCATATLAAAEQSFRRLLALEPTNTRAISNLAQVMTQAGRDTEAAELRRELARLEPHPPFQFYTLGLAAMERGDYALARDMFAKEVARADYYHEFHYWLALSLFRLGDIDAARKQMALALEYSTTRRERDLYAAKLAWIRSRPAALSGRPASAPGAGPRARAHRRPRAPRRPTRSSAEDAA
jgi:tetratricopeptide (TPR) repeat protein